MGLVFLCPDNMAARRETEDEPVGNNNSVIGHGPSWGEDKFPP